MNAAPVTAAPADTAPAVLLGLSYTSLPVARSLGRRGIAVIGLDPDPAAIGTRCRYVQPFAVSSDDAALLPALLDLGAKFGRKAVLYPFGDEQLLFVARHREQLASHFWLHHQPRHALDRLVGKETLGDILAAAGAPMPRSAVFDHEPPGGWARLEVDLEFPVVIKPDHHEKWLDDPRVVARIGRRKALLVDDLGELRRRCADLAAFDTIIAQEYIPGPSENLHYYVGYRNQSGHMLVSFVGRKLRTYPDRFGTESYLQSVADPTLCRVAEALLARLDYVGVAGLDFKYDARDSRLRLIEINWRFGLSDGLLSDCGVDLPWIFYRDIQGLPTQPALDYRTDVRWLWLEKELEWIREYGTSQATPLLRWLGQLLDPRCSHAVLACDDLQPFLQVLGGLARRAWQALPGVRHSGHG